MSTITQRVLLGAALLALAACNASNLFQTPRKVGAMVNGRQDGPWKYFYENGAKQAEGYYNHDRQDRRWTYWYDNGDKQWEVGFAGEQFSGPTMWWWKGNLPRAHGVFERGLELGTWTYWNADGKFEQQGDYDDGRASLEWTHWYPSGAVRARGAQWKGERVGRWEFFGEEGTAFAHVFPTPPGLELHVERWDDGSPRRQGFLSGGARVGRWITLHENGVRRTSGAIVDGRAEGTWLFYRPDGTVLASIDFAKGEPASDWLTWSGMSAQTVGRGSLRSVEVGTRFSSSSDAAGKRIQEVVSTWLAEALSPLTVNSAPPTADAPEPPADLLADTGRKPSLPLQAQPWTVREEENMQFLVKLYTDGAPNMVAPSGGGQYGGGPHTTRRERDGDTKRSNPLIGRKLGFAQVHTRDGKTLDLHSLESKPLVLVILRGMSGEICVYCYTQVRALCDAMPQFAEAGANVVVVYPGESDRLETFWDALKRSEEFEGRDAPFTFAYDPGFELVKALSIEGNLALPTTLVFDGAGSIRFAYVGEDSADRPDAARLVQQVRGLHAP